MLHPHNYRCPLSTVLWQAGYTILNPEEEIGDCEDCPLCKVCQVGTKSSTLSMHDHERIHEILTHGVTVRELRKDKTNGC